MALGKDGLDAATVDETLGILLKYEDDVSRVRGETAAELLGRVERELAAASLD